MQAPLERVGADPGSSFRFLHRRTPSLGYNPHHHHLYELICHLDGQGEVFVAERIASYAGPCAFLVGPDLPHTYHWVPAKGKSEHECLVLQVDPAAIDHLQSIAECTALAPLLKLARGGAAVTGEPALAMWQLVLPFAKTSGIGRLRVLLDTLAVMAAGKPRSIATPLRRRATTPVAKAQDWIQAHLDEPVTLETLGRITGLHPRSLARSFRRETGHSVIAYVHLLRIGRACEMLASGHDDVAGCCFAVGFGNLAHFNRVFRRITGHTPTGYRRLIHP